jgi:hypothetical protein
MKEVKGASSKQGVCELKSMSNFAFLALLLMKSIRKVERKPLVDTTAATVDVDALWADMVSGTPKTKDQNPAAEATSTIDSNESLSPESKRNLVAQTGKESRSPSTILTGGPDSMIMINRTYNFAGKVHTEQKLVPRNSAEAKLYLASQPINTKPTSEEEVMAFAKPKRPTKKARRSVFEPLSELPQRKDLHFGVRRESDVVLLNSTKDTKKLNTVEKSAMDWAGFVDKEGIADELDAAGKSKGAYKSRQEFLARVEQKKEEDARRVRGLLV